MLSLTMRPDLWQPPIVKTIATENKGIEELADAIARYHEYLQHTEASLAHRTAIARWRILELLRERLLARALDADGANEQLDELALEVASKRRDPYSAVDMFIAAGTLGERRGE
jgi:LAO/AO transport system kinase